MQKRKITILFICPYPVGQAPSQRFRFEQYLNILTEAGFAFSIKPFFSEKTWTNLYKKGHLLQKTAGIIGGFISRFLLLFKTSGFDYIFIHREALPVGPPVYEFVLAVLLKKKIIYDFDDAIWLANTSDENKLVERLKWHGKVKSICRWSYKVSCGNDFLCNYARQYSENVVCNPTTIDTQNLHNRSIYPKKNSESFLTIGWTGTHSTLKYLNILIPVFQSLQKKFRDHVRFLVIADKRPGFELASLDFKPWSKSTEISDLLNMDIGVMPLTDDAWAQGKCGFKALQYMALGIPAVVSFVGVNKEIINSGKNGFLCSTPELWEASLERLLTEELFRVEMGLKGREKVQENYSVLSNASNFTALFS